MEVFGKIHPKVRSPTSVGSKSFSFCSFCDLESAAHVSAFRITSLQEVNAALGRRWPVNVDQPGLRGEPERLL